VKTSIPTLLITVALFTSHTVRMLAQEPDEFSELSIEELFDTKIVATNVLGTHTHFTGEWMIGYSYMSMDMRGNRSGTLAVTDSDVLQDFMVAPTLMEMETHMLMVMYGVSDRLTLMVMAPLRRTNMDHVTRMGMLFTTESSGIGDIGTRATWSIIGRAGEAHRLMLDAGATLPTGTVDARGDTPAATATRLSYPMQLGTGTFSINPGVTYLGEGGPFAWMLEGTTKLQLGRNSEGYALGHRHRLSGAFWWGATDWFSPVTRMSWEQWGDVKGADGQLNPMMVPTADPNLRAGRRLDMGLGVQFYRASGFLREQRIAMELTLPLYQSLDGPQLQTVWAFRVTMARTF
jgi:hypothetical protein